jgi:thioredoxin-related protein
VKKVLFAFLFGLCSYFGIAQTVVDTVPAYKRLPDVPPFNITLVSDSTAYAKENLKKRKQTLIMLFSPDCGHCEHTTREILAKYDAFKNVQIIMVSSLTYEAVKKFHDNFKIADYPTIKMGTDKNFFLGSFYKLTSYPTIFLYNKKGKFKATFNSGNTVEDIIAAL